MNEPSSGPTTRMVTHHAAACRRRDRRRGRSAAFREADDRPRRGQRHDDDDEQRLGVVDGVVEVVLRGRPTGMQRDGDEQRDDPEAEDDFHFAEEVQHLGRRARPWRQTCRPRALVVPALNTMCERREPRGRKGVQDGERKDGGCDDGEGIHLRPQLQRGEQAVGRNGVGVEWGGKHLLTLPASGRSGKVEKQVLVRDRATPSTAAVATVPVPVARHRDADNDRLRHRDRVGSGKCPRGAVGGRIRVECIGRFDILRRWCYFSRNVREK